ncbi:histidine N-alpha-methyltransferase-like [Pecten maximus]|uniref:histidine N-alpha-methyltransferase-like n=1 Tax=Pecten maximus TaxID=6579 RepID=UPI001458E10D|nr:histidine N-alpha-methyltransferase-like [Pecten maximus]
MEVDKKRILIRGLTANPKYIPSWYIYDETGSKLHHIFATENPNYYLTESQVSVLQNNIQEIIPRLPYEIKLVDLGCGNCSKTRHIIDDILKRQHQLSFYPVDVSEDFLMTSARELKEEYGDSLLLSPIAKDYIRAIEELKKVEGPKIILWIGSISNLTYTDQVTILRMISTMMSDKCRLLFSADITQDKEAIIKAYNDDTGLTREFIQNAAVRLNKETGSQIDLARFTYEVDFICDKTPQSLSYVRAYIKAKESIQDPIPGLGIDLVIEKGGRLYFHEGDGFSNKYTLEQLRNIVEKSGLQLADSWTDDQKHAVFCSCTTAT